MSFILDALRKSESRRRAGQPPRLDDDYPASGPSGRGPRSGLLRVLGAVLIVVVIAVAAAFVVGPDWLDRDRIVDANGHADRPSPSDRYGSEPSPAAPVAEMQVEEPAQAEVAAVVQEEGEPVVADSGDETDETETAVRDRRQVRRAAPERTVVREAPVREHVIAGESEAMDEIERQIAKTIAEELEYAATLPAEEPEPVIEPESEESEPWRPEASEYVRAWELPLAVRRSLPELNLTIHVFTPQQDSRFVLINGERYVPGDQIGTDIRLVDIRREGAIVDFREHRFLLEP